MSVHGRSRRFVAKHQFGSLSAYAQQGERVRRIGMLIPLNADDKVAQDRIAVFVQGLKELGWIEGRNVQFDIRLGAGVATTLKQATEMVALAPEVILANGSAAMGPLLQGSGTITNTIGTTLPSTWRRWKFSGVGNFSSVPDES